MICRRNPFLDDPGLEPLSVRLGNCPDAIAQKTLEATTQLRDPKLNMGKSRNPPDEPEETGGALLSTSTGGKD